jgi:hypothetical protein
MNRRIVSSLVAPLVVASAFTATSASSAPALSAQNNDVLTALLADVSDVAAPGTPSPLAVWGTEAEVVVVGNAGRGLKAPAIAAGTIGRGRFVALPHNGYFGAGALEKGQTGHFLVNAVKWAAGGTKKQKVRVAARGQELVDLLNQNGCEARVFGKRPLAEEFKDVDVVCGLGPELTDAEFPLLDQLLADGGGVIAAQCAWGWMQVTNSSSLEKNSLNRFFGKHGVAWTAGFLGKSGEVGFVADREPPKLAHADAALEYLSNHRDPTKVKNLKPMQQAEATATAVIPFLPRDDVILRPRFTKLAEDVKKALSISAKQPIPASDGGRRTMLSFLLHEAEIAPPDKVEPFACAKSFPGELPANAPRVTRTIAIDASVPRWHSTGCYAAAGEVVTVTLPEGKDVEKAGLELQIGAHSDDLTEVGEWKRAPKVVHRVPLDHAKVAAASAFGGLVYVDVPDGCALGKFELTIGPVVEAPRFVLDATKLDEWKSRLRSLPAPWAELESSKVIVTVPSTVVRALDDPESTLRTWDRVLDAAADFVATTRARKSPERYVADVEISAGYMHSGYPIMTQLDAAETMSDPKKLAAGDWGLFHELGHNHQEADWTFEGTSEVTNNVICAYVLDTVCGVAPLKGHDAIAAKAKIVPAYLKDGAKFDDWKEDPFLALQMYLQVQQAFGWDVYKKAFADYRSLSGREKPRSDDAKRDLWLVTLSKACGRDLGPFFTAWGVPTSDAARATAAKLPKWMPEGFPPSGGP